MDIESSDDLVRLVLETFPHGAFFVRPDGSAAIFNAAYLSYAGPEHVSTTPEQRMALVHPDDHDEYRRIRSHAVERGIGYILEARLRRHDGVYRWHRIHNVPVRQDGRIIGWTGTSVDFDDIRRANERLEKAVAERTAALEAANAALLSEIAERQRLTDILSESREKFRVLYDRTPMALHSVDTSARLIDVNDGWLALFQYARAEVLGRSPTEFMTPESADLYRSAAWPDMLASVGEARTMEYRFVRHDGSEFDGRLSSRGEFDDAGQLIRTWAAIADITAEKRAQAQLRHAQKIEAIGQLTSGIAHDFNNLLTTVLGSLEMLRKRVPADERVDRLISNAQTAAERGARLTRQLLAFSRKQALAPERLDLNALIRRMEELVRSTVDANIRIQTALDPRVWPALADATQLELVVLNLAINARDAMPTGGVLTLATGNETVVSRERLEEPEPGEYAVVRVSDTGSGISADIMDRVFEPFFTTKPVGKGSGLGLPQVVGVAQQLGGGVRIESAPGKGTTVSVYLRRMESDVA